MKCIPINTATSESGRVASLPFRNGGGASS